MRATLTALMSMFMVSACAHAPAKTRDFFADATGAWTGTLTYLNYGAPVEDFTIPATLTIAPEADGYRFSYAYPGEPDQNASAVIAFNATGKRFGDEALRSDTRANGVRTLETEASCEDMGKAAACRKIYQLGAGTFTLRKIVTPADGSPAFRRNVYTFTR